jgi:hypothetical protein
VADGAKFPGFSTRKPARGGLLQVQWKFTKMRAKILIPTYGERY